MLSQDSSLALNIAMGKGYCTAEKILRIGWNIKSISESPSACRQTTLNNCNAELLIMICSCDIILAMWLAIRIHMIHSPCSLSMILWLFQSVRISR